MNFCSGGSQPAPCRPGSVSESPPKSGNQTKPPHGLRIITSVVLRNSPCGYAAGYPMSPLRRGHPLRVAEATGVGELHPARFVALARCRPEGAVLHPAWPPHPDRRRRCLQFSTHCHSIPGGTPPGSRSQRFKARASRRGSGESPTCGKVPAETNGDLRRIPSRVLRSQDLTGVVLSCRSRTADCHLSRVLSAPRRLKSRALGTSTQAGMLSVQWSQRDQVPLGYLS